MEQDPIKLAEHVFRLSQEYRKLYKELSEIKKNSGIEWLEIRKNTSTDKSADKAYDASHSGSRALELKFLLEGMSKEMSAAKNLGYAYQTHNF